MRVATLFILLAGLAGSPIAWAGPQAPSIRSGERISLQKQLETGLKARRAEEFAFIKRVVTLVEQHRLPRKLVEETFVWARQKQRYPYVYFERALKIRASRIGISL